MKKVARKVFPPLLRDYRSHPVGLDPGGLAYEVQESILVVKT